MKNTRTITINGYEFELCKDLLANYNDIKKQGYRNIYEAYKNPSYCKKMIWDGWNEWFRSIAREAGCDADWWISGCNLFKFTIKGKVKIGIDYYMLVITVDHNRAYRLIG